MYRGPNKNFYQSKKEIKARRNHMIQISPVRLIDEFGEQVGVVETSEALRRANEAGLDLVEISPKAQPPVCKIIDWGKYQYQQSKKQQDNKLKQKKVETKGIRIFDGGPFRLKRKGNGLLRRDLSPPTGARHAAGDGGGQRQPGFALGGAQIGRAHV